MREFHSDDFQLKYEAAGRKKGLNVRYVHWFFSVLLDFYYFWVGIGTSRFAFNIVKVQLPIDFTTVSTCFWIEYYQANQSGEFFSIDCTFFGGFIACT
jgi:hypothetical protein